MTQAKRQLTKRQLAKRQRAWRFGRMAEMVCAASLRLKGYRILASRYRNPFGEIDLIARRGKVVCFIEVKARGNLADAAEAVGLRQRRRVARAAESYLASRADLATSDVRFDVMLVCPWDLPRHLPDAWRPD